MPMEELDAAVLDELWRVSDSPELTTPIDVEVAAEALSKLGAESALEVLKGLADEGAATDDPTTWLIEAAVAIADSEQQYEGEYEQVEVEVEAEEEDESYAEASGPAQKRLRIMQPSAAVAARMPRPPGGVLRPPGGMPRAPGPFRAGWVAGSPRPMMHAPARAGAPVGVRHPLVVPGVRPGVRPGIIAGARRPGVTQPVRPGVHSGVRVPARSSMATAVRPGITPLAAIKGMKGSGKGGKDSGKSNGKSRKFKTDLCRNFQRGRCDNGASCPFAHGEKEREAGLAMQLARLNQQVEKFKTRLCNYFLAGKCTRGENCSFAHGKEELDYSRQEAFEEGVSEHVGTGELGVEAPQTPPMSDQPRFPTTERASVGVGQDAEAEEEQDAGDWDWDWEAEGEAPDDSQALEEGSDHQREEVEEALRGNAAAFADLQEDEDDPGQGHLAPQTPPSPEGSLQHAAPCTPPDAA